MTIREYDLIIVGGGPAGSTCARYAAESGLKVAILEYYSQPKKRTSAGIFDHTWAAMDKCPEDYPYEMKTPHAFDFTTHKDRKPLPNVLKAVTPLMKRFVYFPNRDEFDGWLLDLAKEAGAEVFTESAVKPGNITYDDGYTVTVGDVIYQSPVLVGAAGTLCPVYRQFFGKQSDWPGQTMLLTEIEAPETLYYGPRWSSYFGFMSDNIFAWAFVVGDGYVHIGTAVMSTEKNNKKDMLFNEFVDYLKAINHIDQDFDPGEFHSSGGAIRMFAEAPMSTNDSSCHVIGDAAGLLQCDAYNGISSAITSGRMCAENIVHNIQARNMRDSLNQYLYQDIRDDMVKNSPAIFQKLLGKSAKRKVARI